MSWARGEGDISTPKRRSSQLYAKPLDKLNSTERQVWRCTEQCQGKPIQSVRESSATDSNAAKGKRSRMPCFHCGAQMPWYCTECHHYLCMEPSSDFIKMEGLSDGRIPLVRIHNANGTSVPGRKCCFICFHWHAYENVAGNEEDDNEEQQPSNLLIRFNVKA